MNGRRLTNLAGALIEAWDELRIHKLRVLLSLVGVAVAVAAMTFVLAIGQIFGQANSEFMERMSGRQITLTAAAYQTSATGGAPDTAAVVQAYRGAVDRFQITHSSVIARSGATMRGTTATIQPQLTLIDPSYGIIHRRSATQGRWLEDGDSQRRAPALVVNEIFMTRSGLPPLSEHPEVHIPGDPGFTAVVVGVVPNDSGQWTEPQAWALYDSWSAAAASGGTTASSDPMYGDGGVPQLEVWVDPAQSARGTDALRNYLAGELGETWQVDVMNNDQSQWGDPTAMFQTIVLGIGILVLALGALSLVNITLVTVKHRVREIGIRRSFGATSGRVFFSIMLESVVATAVAGVAGVGLAIVAMRYFPVAMWLSMPVEDTPAFPMSTAVVGLAAATVVGALAGLLPAIYAVRVRPVDAIRT